jgi:hypothetical protein
MVQYGAIWYNDPPPLHVFYLLIPRSALLRRVKAVCRLPEGATMTQTAKMRIPAMPITHSDLMAITIPSDADHRRSEATLGCSYHAEVIGIRQAFCC